MAAFGPYRHLVGSAAWLSFGLATVPDAAVVAAYCLMVEAAEDQYWWAVLAAGCLRVLVWVVHFCMLRRTTGAGFWSLVGIAGIVLLFMSRAQTALRVASVVVWFAQVFFMLLYPATWTEPHQPLSQEAQRQKEQHIREVAAMWVSPASLLKPEKQPWLLEYGDADDDKPVVIVLGGMPMGNLASGTVVMPFLRCGYHVALIEYPGAGCTRHQVFTLDELRARAQQYITELQARRGCAVALYGVSGGGNAVLHLAAKLGPGLVSAVVSVVAAAPGTSVSYTNDRSEAWHPLAMKTRVESRMSPDSVIRKVLGDTLRKHATDLASLDPKIDDDNLELNVPTPLAGENELAKIDPNDSKKQLTTNAAAGAGLDECSASGFFHAPDLLKERFEVDIAKNRDEFVEVMGNVSKQMIAWLDSDGLVHDLGLFYSPEMYPEYVHEYLKNNVCGKEELQQIEVPVLFMGAVGDPASIGYDNWATHLRSEAPYEMVIAAVKNPGVGGLNSHTFSAQAWRRHILTANRFIKVRMSASV